MNGANLLGSAEHHISKQHNRANTFLKNHPQAGGQGVEQSETSEPRTMNSKIRLGFLNVF